MKLKTCLIVVAAPLLLAGCAGQLARQAVLRLKPGERIAVVSLVSEKPRFYGTGTTVFNDVRGTLPAKSWDFNPYIENLVARDVSKAGFDVVKLDSKKIMAAAGPATHTRNGWSSAMVVHGGVGRLVKAAAQYDARELLVVGTGRFQDPWFLTNTYLSGYGVYQRDFLGMRSSHTTRTYVDLNIWLLNVKTGSETGPVSCRQAHSRWMKFWINKPSDFTKANAVYTRAKLHELIGKAEAACIREIGFSPRGGRT